MKALVVVLAATFLASGYAGAETLEEAFRAVAARPGDADAALRYARLLAERGETRPAIAVLERVLRLNPSLDNIRLEIASLYLAAGSPDLAALYAQQARRSSAIPPDVAGRTDTLIAQAERGAARSVLDVNLFAGARHDSNANEATSLGTVPIYVDPLGAFFPAAVSARGRSDWSSVLSAQASHRFDLGLQRTGSWETNASAFDQRFARIPRDYDLTIASLDTGPRIGITDFADGAAVLALRPFATAGWIGYGDSTYAWLYGAGLTAELRLPPRWTFELTALGRQGDYSNTGFRPRARDYTGFEWNGTAAVSYDVTASTRLTAAVSAYTAGARQEYYERHGFGALIGASTIVALGSYEVGLTARAGVRTASFEAPDPVLDPFRKRSDTRWEAGATAVFPVTQRIAVAVEYGFTHQRSNYAIYRYNNHAVTVGLRLAL